MLVLARFAVPECAPRRRGSEPVHEPLDALERAPPEVEGDGTSQQLEVPRDRVEVRNPIRIRDGLLRVRGGRRRGCRRGPGAAGIDRRPATGAVTHHGHRRGRQEPVTRRAPGHGPISAGMPVHLLKRSHARRVFAVSWPFLGRRPLKIEPASGRHVGSGRRNEHVCERSTNAALIPVRIDPTAFNVPFRRQLRNAAPGVVDMIPEQRRGRTRSVDLFSRCGGARAA